MRKAVEVGERVWWWLIGMTLVVGLVAVIWWLVGVLGGWAAVAVMVSTVLMAQSGFTLVWMLYAWENPEKMERQRAPRSLKEPKHSFTILIPARDEGRVIGETVGAMARLDYPSELLEVLVLCREDDRETLAVAEAAIEREGRENIRVVKLGEWAENKPVALNGGLRLARGGVVGVFDAEDEPCQNILQVVNTVMAEEGAEVVQSGVQLMNYRSSWFSGLNVLEYFFWFKSGLHFFSQVGMVAPLGGNSVFFKREWLVRVGGWDEKSLTEDADIGFRLAVAGARTRVIYDEGQVTAEETPKDEEEFVKQRTRWNQGFLQILVRGEWLGLPRIRQKLMAVYILLSPLLQALLLVYAPISVGIALWVEMPVVVGLYLFAPLGAFGLQLVVLVVGMWEFCKAYKLKFPMWMPVKLLMAFFPYQVLLLVSSARATVRLVLGRGGWEKTEHLGVHRQLARWAYV